MIEGLLGTLKAREYAVDESIAKVSIVGTGMKSSPGVAAKAFQTLADNGVNILLISTSPIRLSMVVKADQVERAVCCLHTAFGLDSDSVFEEKMLSAEELAAKKQKGQATLGTDRFRQEGVNGFDEGKCLRTWSPFAAQPVR